MNNVMLSDKRPIGEVIDYFYRVEFHQRGWPHLHCLFWVKNAPQYSSDSDDSAVIEFIDKYVSCSIPSQHEDKELNEIVCSVQLHSKNHSKSCKKSKTTCRFKFPRPPMKRTCIVSPAKNKDIDNIQSKCESDKSGQMPCIDDEKAKEIMQTCWKLLQQQDISSIEQLYEQAGISHDVLVKVLSLLTCKEAIFLKRNSSECWVNNYNADLLRTWNGNMDIQFVLNPYSCIMYIVSYISKAEREMGTLLKSAQEARQGNLDAISQLRKLGSVYLTHRELSLMEAVYRVTSMKLKSYSRKVIFIPLDPDSQRISMPLSQLQHMPNDSEDIWFSNIVDKYYARPKTNQYSNMWLALFAAQHHIKRTSTNTSISLDDHHGFIQKRIKKLAVIRYNRIKMEADPEKNYYGILKLYFPHTQKEFRTDPNETYQTFFQTGIVQDIYGLNRVKDIVQTNMQKFERSATDLDNALNTMQEMPQEEDAWCLTSNEKPDDDSIEEDNFESEILSEPNCIPDFAPAESSISNTCTFVNLPTLDNVGCSTDSDSDNTSYQSLNDQQQKLFRYITTWCYKKNTR